MTVDFSKITGGLVDLGGQTISGLALIDRNFDAANPLTITNGVIESWRLTNCANIRFRDVDLTRSASANAALYVRGGGAIQLTDFRLDAAGSPGDAKAIELVGVTDWVIADGDLHQFNIAIAARSSDNGQILRNDFHDFNEDCIRLVSARGVVIEDNDFHDFLLVASGTGIHPDAVQGFVENGRQIQDIAIRANRIWRGQGGAFQGIFFRNYPGVTPPTGVTIERNIIVGSTKNAISAVGGATVRDNMVIDMTGDAIDLPHITWAGAGVTLSGNVAPKYTDQTLADPYRTPTPAGNTLNKAISAAEAQPLLDGWRTSEAPPPEPVPDPAPAPFSAEQVAWLDARYAPRP